MAQPDFSITAETKEFDRHVQQFLKKTNIASDLVLRKFAFDLLKRIMKKNPVDTGRSRGAWYVSMEKLGMGMMSLPTGKNYNEEEVKKGKQKGEFTDHTKGHWDKWIEMVNGVSYIIYLEYGWSKQAPYGMVRLSMRELRKGKLPQDMADTIRQEWNKFYRY